MRENEKRIGCYTLAKERAEGKCHEKKWIIAASKGMIVTGILLIVISVLRNVIDLLKQINPIFSLIFVLILIWIYWTYYFVTWSSIGKKKRIDNG